MAAQRRSRGEHGFTLVELLVGLTVTALLLTIAIPQLLGARSRARDKAAQSSLVAVEKAARIAIAETSWSGLTAATVRDVLGSSVTVNDAFHASTGPTDVEVLYCGPSCANPVIAPPLVTLFASSASGTCWVLAFNPAGTELRGRLSDTHPCTVAYSYLGPTLNVTLANW